MEKNIYNFRNTLADLVGPCSLRSHSPNLAVASRSYAVPAHDYNSSTNFADERDRYRTIARQLDANLFKMQFAICS